MQHKCSICSVSEEHLKQVGKTNVTLSNAFANSLTWQARYVKLYLENLRLKRLLKETETRKYAV